MLRVHRDLAGEAGHVLLCRGFRLELERRTLGEDVAASRTFCEIARSLGLYCFFESSARQISGSEALFHRREKRGI